MKLSDIVGEPLRTIAYYPRLRRLTGSANATLLLCQLIYWTGKQRDPEGWIEKRATRAAEDRERDGEASIQSLELETGLTYRELRQARRLLREKGFLRERSRRAEHRLYFQVDQEALLRAWNEHYGEHPPKTRSTPDDSSSDTFPKGDGHLPNARLSSDESSSDIAPNRDSLICTSRDYTETITQHVAQKPQAISKVEGPLGWSIAHGLPVSQQQLERERDADLATSAFESALGVQEWPWASTRVWEKMAALVAEAWKQDPQIFREYADWIEGEGKYKAMSVKQIRINPQQFIDTGWPLFMVSRKPREPEPVQGESDMARRVREWEAEHGKDRELDR